MSSHVVTSRENESIRGIATKMQRFRVGSVVVVNKSNEPIGIITQGDIVRRLVTKKRMLLFSQAKHIMSRPVLTIRKDEKIEDAAKAMAERKVKRLCVVDENKKLIGVITDNDIMRSAGSLIDVLNEMIDTGYEKGEGREEVTVGL